MHAISKGISVNVKLCQVMQPESC